MCLIITVKAKQPLGDKAKLISQADDTLLVSEKRNLLLKPNGVLSLSLDGGCACSTLADDADWNDEHWEMDPQALVLMANTVERIAEHVPDGFTFEALWVGDKPKEKLTVTLKEMVTIIRAGQIGTRTSYEVTSIQ